MPKEVGLSAERIVQVALSLVDREGLDALSVRRLAAELGVGAMTLYGYFRTKSELLDALADAAVEEIDQPDTSLPWDLRLRQCMIDLCQILIRHPSAIPLLTSRPPRSPSVLRGMELAMQCLRDGGLNEQEAGRTYMSLLAYVFGFASFAAGGRDGRGGIAAPFPEEQFTYGLDGLLAGLGARRKRVSSRGAGAEPSKARRTR